MPVTTTGKATDFINFSRASLATVTDSDGKVKWAPHNLLTASEQFDSANWSVTGGVTVTANSTAAPNGTTTADTLAFTSSGYHYQTVSIGSSVAGMTVTIGVWLWTATSKATMLLRLCGQTTGTDETKQLITLTSTPTLYTISRTFTSSDINIQFGLDNRTTAGGDGIAGNVIAWGAHVYRSDLGGMVANTSAYPMYNPTTPKNLLGYTEDFSNAAWTKLRASVSSNTAVAPNGLTTADTLVEDTTASNNHFVQSATLAFVSGGTYTYSCYLKAKERTWAQLEVYRDTNYSAYFNLSAGAVGTTTNSTAQIVNVGDGWYRCSIKFTVTTGGNGGSYVLLATGNSTRDYTGNGTSGIYLWGAQLSDSASLDPYISNPFAAPTAGAYHGPRLDYDPVTLASKGLLVEEQRTNLLLRSAEFDNAAWQSKQAITVTANATTAPSGAATADKIVEDTTSDIHRIGQYNSGLSAVAYAYSVYVKPEGSARRLYINLVSLAGTGALFDFTGSGSVIASSGAAANRASSISAVGGGWFRCVVIGTGTATATSAFLQINRASSSTAADDTYTGDGSSGFSFYGAQLEAGSFATSYIPTTSASVTRSADVASVATSAFPYSAAEGTLVASAAWTNAAVSNKADQRIVSMTSPGDNYARLIQRQDNNATGVSVFYRGMSGYTNIAGSGNSAKIGMAWSASGGSGSANGSAASALTGTPTTSDSQPINFLRIGNANDSTFFNGHIRQITYIPRRLSNAELQSRTA